MSDATFETFLVSGLLVLIAAIGYMAWAAWRWVDRERDMEKRALTGVSYELRHNLKRMMSELAGLANGSLTSDIEIIPVVHPQLDALLSRPNEADRGGLTVIRSNYNELSAHKQSLRAALANQADVNLPANVAADAVIGSLATLYLWEEHKGCAPEAARSTRSWDVRDWMKANKFHADSLPGLHLRDQVVERLRQDGMTLTPKPLTYTASEYFAKQYDRKADPNAPFWKRKKKKPSVDEAVEAAAVAGAVVAADAMAEPEPEPVPTPEPVVETAPEVVEVVETSPEASVQPPEETAAPAEPSAPVEPEIAAEPESESEAEFVPESQATDPDLPETDLDPVESSVESAPPSKPPTPGVVH
ncbi:MAG: hypothetical protein AAGL97_00415 [Pseudomonadota bacterium]